MYKQLQRLFDCLDETIPKYAISTNRIVDINSEVNTECKVLFSHMVEMGQIHLTHNVYGIQTVRDTTIPVETSMERKGFIISRYGRIKIPVNVIM